MPTPRPPAEGRGEPIWLREATREPNVYKRQVSIRRIAAELDARPMSLYGHIGGKDDLLDLMHDAAAEETLVGEVPADWREALRKLARCNRAAALRHPWLLVTRDTGCAIGPASLRRMDESAAAVRGLDVDGATRRALVLAVETFTYGHVSAELAGRIRRRATEEVDVARREAAARYVREQVDAGGLPHLADAGPSEPPSAQESERSFELGLDWLLAGAAASLGR